MIEMYYFDYCSSVGRMWCVLLYLCYCLNIGICHFPEVCSFSVSTC